MNYHVDIETLGTEIGSTIMEIGVVCEEQGMDGAGLINIAGDGLHLQRHMKDINFSPDTLAFHGPEQIAKWRHSEQGMTELQMLESLAFHCVQITDADTVWMWRSHFDQPHLHNLSNKTAMPLPWKWWQVKCSYTYCKAMAEVCEGVRLEDFGETAHTALADAKNQSAKRALCAAFAAKLITDD